MEKGILMFTTLIMAVAFVGSCLMLGNGVLPWIMCGVTGLWLCLFMYANLCHGEEE